MLTPPPDFPEALFWGRLTWGYLIASMLPDQRPLGKLTERKKEQYPKLESMSGAGQLPALSLSGSLGTDPHPRPFPET